MKKVITFIVVAISLNACKKDKTGILPVEKPLAFADFIKGREWVGTLNGSGFQYAQPGCLKFNADNTFTIYSLFVFFPGGIQINRDSINGNIISIDSLPDGRQRITTNINTSFTPITTSYIYVTDRKKITGMSADVTQQPTFQLEIFPAEGISVAGQWSGKPRTAPGANFEYPDLSSITFVPSENSTYYIRNGVSVLLTAPNNLLKIVYQQKGARIYMAGYIENLGVINGPVPYFGVLMPDGKKMLVDSKAYNSRLPAYVYTNEPYGPNGVTPTILRP